jgi:hypothetical protein
MKKAKKEGGVGLQEWLSYQSRTREVVQPETDIIDWDEGIEVQEEWLPRELCEQRLREEAERQLAPVAINTPASSVTMAEADPSSAATPSPVVVLASVVEVEVVEVEVVEVDDVPLTAPATAPTTTPATAPLTAVPSQVGAVPMSPMMIARQPETKEISSRESRPWEFRSKQPAPTQFESNDLASAVPAFYR